MRKLNKKDYINLFVLVLVFIGVFFWLTKGRFIYGSTKDWNSQHWIIPDYFRQLFYKTRSLVPSFAFNLGGGQNIFNLSYYGFLSPFVLFSYLLPYIDMVYYMIGASIVIVISSVILLYIWLYNNKYDSKVCFLSSLIFLLAAPLIFHSHRHIMFINYMPFLILGLIAVDRLFLVNKRSLFIFSMLLIIMTSYFYSVGCFFTLFIYGTYKYLNKMKRKEKFSVKSYLKWCIKYLSNFLVAIMMGAILLLPTAYSLFSGRSIEGSSINILSLLIPKLNVRFLLYGAYSIGLGAIFIVCLIDNWLSKRKKNMFAVGVVALFTIIPVFVYLLNGTMYIDSKVLIPCLPFCCLLIANTFRNFFQKKYEFKKIILPIILVSFIIIIFSKAKFSFFYILDVSVLLIFINRYDKTRKKAFIFIPVIVLSLVNCLLANDVDKLVSFDELKRQNLSDQIVLIGEVLDDDNGVYRISNQYLPLITSNRIFDIKHYQSSIYSSVSNKYYKDFYYNHSGNEIMHRSYGMLGSVNNVIYNIYMGNKYLLSENISPIGYEEVKKEDVLTLYKNDDVLPIGYATSNVISLEEYEKLEFPYNSEAILNNVILDDNISSEFESSIEKVKLDYIVKSNKDTIFKKRDNSVQIRAEDTSEMVLEFDKPLKEKLLFIKFKVDNRKDCKFGDVSITINGIKNKVTCESWKYHNKNYEFDYVISSNESISELTINFSNGLHEIYDVETFTMDYDKIKEISHNVDEFIIDSDKTNGDYIVGEINVSQDKCFHLSIPYDEGFEILVDGEVQDYYKSDLNFIGFNIKKGNHKIEIKYTAPLLKEGMIISMIGVISFISICWYERKR